MPNEALPTKVRTPAPGAEIAAQMADPAVAKSLIAESLSSKPGFGRCVATDALGRLYDPNFRQFLSRSAKLYPEALANIESVAAMGTTARAMQQFFEDELETFGISHAQYKVLVWIRECGKEGTQLHAIADSLRVTPRNVTGLIDSLEAQGLVERVPDPTDRRATIARLTELGEAKAGAAWRTHMKNIRDLLGVLTDDEKQILRHAALKLIRAIEETAARGSDGVAGRRKSNG